MSSEPNGDATFAEFVSIVVDGQEGKLGEVGEKRSAACNDPLIQAAHRSLYPCREICLKRACRCPSQLIAALLSKSPHRRSGRGKQDETAQKSSSDHRGDSSGCKAVPPTRYHCRSPKNV